MPGAMRKMGVYLGLVEEDDPEGYDRADDYDEPGYGRGERTDRSAVRGGATAVGRRDTRTGTTTLARGEWSEPTHTDAPPSAYGRYEDDDFAPVAVPAPPVAPVAPPAAPSYRITTLHPRTYNEARQIGEHYRGGTPVIMNLSEMDDADAKRLVDFAAGLTFGLRGRLERVTAKVFLLSPQNVTVTAEDKARIVEGGFFNQS